MARGAGEERAKVRSPELSTQLRTLLPTLLLVAGLVVVVGTIILTIYVTTHVNVHHLVADPAEIALLPEYTGIFSHLGILVLWTGAVISVMTGLLKSSGATGRLPSVFLVSFGVLIGLLAVDDLFMLHEWAGLLMAEAVGSDDIASLRSRLEVIVFALIGVAWLAWLVRFRQTILTTEYLLLLAAMAGFGLSIAIDLSGYIVPALEPKSLRMRTTVSVLEELLKLAGILLMVAYAWRMCRPILRGITGRA